MTHETILENPAKQLFRNFSFNLGDGHETLLVLDLLATSRGVRWFTEIMDEVETANELRLPDIGRHEVEKKLVELKMTMNDPMGFSLPLRTIS